MEIFWSDKIGLEHIIEFKHFLQGMANRIAVGRLRYGEADRRKKYLVRLEMEIDAYKKTGNYEHLLNAANYCFLESIAPHNKKLHFDSAVESVTRGIIDNI